MAKKLKSLEEHNREKLFPLHERTGGIGVACPKCGAELYNESPGLVLTSSPPMIRTKCSSCTYHGLAYA